MSRTIVIILAILVISLVLLFAAKREQKRAARPGMIKYVALGDSYTIGHGVSEAESWPAVLAKHLRETGVDVELMANPARSGWNSQDLIDRELPVFDKAEPDFVTIMIGTNDVAQGVPIKTYEQHLIQILDHVQARLPNKQHIVLLTTPDYAVTPTGATYGDPQQTTASIQAVNQVIKDQAQKRDLKVVDLFPLTQTATSEPGLLGPDGLHPSAEFYRRWEAEIYPVVLEVLGKRM